MCINFNFCVHVVLVKFFLVDVVLSFFDKGIKEIIYGRMTVEKKREIKLHKRSAYINDFFELHLQNSR